MDKTADFCDITHSSSTENTEVSYHAKRSLGKDNT